MSVYLLYNAKSGSGFAHAFAAAAGYPVIELNFGTLRDDLAGRIEKGDCLIVCGGDGTMAAVAAVLAEVGMLADIALLPVATGTGNDFAKALGLMVEPSAALVQRQIKEGRQIAVPLWKLNGNYLLLYMGLGFDARIVATVARWRHRLPRNRHLIRLLYALAACRCFCAPKMSGTITLDECKIDLGNYRGLLLANSCSYSGGVRLPAPVFDEATMAAYLFRGPIDLIRLLLRPRSYSNYTLFKHAAFALEPQLAQIDGEECAGAEGVIELAGMLRVVV